VTDLLDTNGAGDAWAAGFLMGYLRNWPLAACGAMASFPRRRDCPPHGPDHPDAHWKPARTKALALGPTFLISGTGICHRRVAETRRSIPGFFAGKRHKMTR